MNTLNLFIPALLLTIGVIRFIKKAVDIAIILIPPLIFSYYTKLSIPEAFIYWFLFVDFLKTTSKIVFSFFNHTITPMNAYKLKLIGKLSSILASLLTIYLILSTYIYMVQVALNLDNILDMLSVCISSYVFISISKFIYLFLFKNKKYKKKS